MNSKSANVWKNRLNPSMQSKIENLPPQAGPPKAEKSAIPQECSCPLDHRIAEAVSEWAMIEVSELREQAWSRLVDLLNLKNAENAQGEAISTPGPAMSRADGGSSVCGGLRRVLGGEEGQA